MKLYEIDQAIQSLLWQLEPDPETGDITMDTDAVIAELNSLQMERQSILDYLARLVLNTRSEAVALRTEEKRLAERRQALEKMDARLMQVLDRECDGKNTDCGVATIRYRAVSRVDVPNPAKAINWLKRHGYKDCYRVHEPEVNKADVKTLLNNGTIIPGVSLVQDRSCSLK